MIMKKLVLGFALAVVFVGPAVAQRCSSQNCLDSMAQGCSGTQCVDSSTKTKTPRAVVAGGNSGGGHAVTKKTTRANRPHQVAPKPQAPGSVFDPDH
jgi:hypothetical protein